MYRLYMEAQTHFRL